MKKIEKQETPGFFTNYIKKHTPKHWDDIASIRTELREHLWREQKCCCAYSEIHLPVYEKNCHIDHFKKRNLYEELTFEYSNLLVSCNSNNYGAKHKDNLIKAKNDYEYLINPVEELPAAHIEYSFTGKVTARNNSGKGEKTIEYFNLNEKTLRERRKTAAFNLQSIEGLTEDEMVEAIGEFETMIRQLYRSC